MTTPHNSIQTEIVHYETMQAMSRESAPDIDWQSTPDSRRGGSNPRSSVARARLHWSRARNYSPCGRGGWKLP